MKPCGLSGKFSQRRIHAQVRADRADEEGLRPVHLTAWRGHCLKMSNLLDSASLARPRHVLVVEDDLVSQAFLRMSLQKHGYAVTPVGSAEAAQEKLEDHGFHQFDCVLTDYWMAEQTGLELIDWINGKDANLSSVILTAEGEKNIVTAALRRGVSDFLEKPVNLQKLFAAIARAVEHTKQQREMVRSNSAVKDLGRAQLWMARAAQNTTGQLVVDVCLYPKLAAGGDFLGHFQTAPEEHCCLLTDVSGHDLQAAYISAYFHGIFRGMLQRATPVTDIFNYFNDFLVHEWNQPDQLKSTRSVGTSLAATALLMDSRRQTVSVLICGAPVPVYVLPNGRAQALGTDGGPPLGWFPGLEARTITTSTDRGGTIYLWTDGLSDLAEAHGVHPLCLAFAIQCSKKKCAQLPWLDEADDDLLFAAIHLPSNGGHAGGLQPFLLENYRGDQLGEIDAMFETWRRNLKCAFPEITEASEHDILLASREAILNALKHGCRQQASQTVQFQMVYHPACHRVRVYVDDPGNGHDFDFYSHDENSGRELMDEHRGLIFIMHLVHSLKFERNGASLTLDFQL